MDSREATNYVIFAVGGTGAKVAEAAVNMLSLGLPMATDADRQTGYGALNANDHLSIIRIDPDKACRAESLQEAIKRYQTIQQRGGVGVSRGLWSLRLNDLISLHPMDALAGPSNIETIEAKLASNDYGRDQAVKILRLFYSQSDISVSLDKGFFQKPYIGAAIIASMAEAGGRAGSELVQLLRNFRGKRLRAFVTGSMYGGTGAAGIPVLSRIVESVSTDDDDWQIAGCMLGPYFYPPSPPVKEIEWSADWSPDSPESLDEFLEGDGQGERRFLESIADRNRGKDLAGPGKDFTWEDIKRIARGYYAKPDEIDRRAFASWQYYHDHGQELFDDRYFLGLRNPTRYGDVVLRREDYPGERNFAEKIPWSNGGSTQISPLHAVEYAAGGLAFHFFTRQEPPTDGTTLLGVHHHDSRTGDALCWSDVAFHPEVEVNRWLAAALVGINWVKYNLLPNIPTRAAFENTEKSLPALHQLVTDQHYEQFHDDLKVISDRIDTTLLHTLRALGWEEDMTDPLMRKWRDHPMSFARVGPLLRRTAPTYELTGWNLKGVDVKAFGREVPRFDEEKDLRGVTDEQAGAQPLGVTYLQSLWNYLAANMKPREA